MRLCAAGHWGTGGKQSSQFVSDLQLVDTRRLIVAISQRGKVYERPALGPVGVPMRPQFCKLALTSHSRIGMRMDIKTEQRRTGLVTPQECGGCGKLITDRFLLRALDLYWHEDCLKCGCCDCRLGEVGSTLYTRANLILCRRDYLRLFGTTGFCAACGKNIPAFEMVMRAKGNVYHLECFGCSHCNHRFCVGDKFYLSCDNKILCEYDYEERLLVASLTAASAPSCSTPITTNKRFNLQCFEGDAVSPAPNSESGNK